MAKELSKEQNEKYLDWVGTIDTDNGIPNCYDAWLACVEANGLDLDKPTKIDIPKK